MENHLYEFLSLSHIPSHLSLSVNCKHIPYLMDTLAMLKTNLKLDIVFEPVYSLNLIMVYFINGRIYTEKFKRKVFFIMGLSS